MDKISIKSEKPNFTSLLHEVSHKPGVYLMRDRLGKVIYVGKARDLRKRLANYFTPSRQKLSDVKTRALIQSIWGFETHEVKNETEAFILEGKLIKEFRPRYNISMRDDKRFLMVKIRLQDKFPRFDFTRLKKEDGAVYYGPFVHSQALRTTIDWLNRHYGLRTCQPNLPGENDYRHCHDDIIKNCSAPCIGKVSQDEYYKLVENAQTVLEGKSKDALEKIEQEMNKASEKLDFERAARLRDTLENYRRINITARKFSRSVGIPNKSTPKEALQNVEDLKNALNMSVAPMIMECFDISNISDTHIVASMVRFKNGLSDKASYRRYRIKTVKGQDDFASMAEVVRRRYSMLLSQIKSDDTTKYIEESHLNPKELMAKISRDIKKEGFIELPDLIIVDGGKGQLSSATNELQLLGLFDIEIIGLAKQHEEIFRPNSELPLQLPLSSDALKLLQRIRDEAHRFANGYHQILMKRRISESLLDECPGISKTKKELLLKRFGSVRRLRKISLEELSSVQGIGEKLANSIINFLNTSK